MDDLNDFSGLITYYGRVRELAFLRVVDLIDSQAWQWDRNKIAGIFAPRTRNEIMAIPLSRDRNKDTLIWKENRKHKFTVMSTTKLLFEWIKGWKWNNHELGRKANCGEWSSTSMYHQRSETLCGGLCPIYCRLEITCIGKEWMRIVAVSSAANTLKLQLTYCGSAPLPTMHGPCLEEEYKSAATMCKIFSSSSVWCKQNWQGRRWNSGLLQLGRYGMQGTKHIFKTFSHNPKWYMKVLSSC